MKNNLVEILPIALQAVKEASEAIMEIYVQDFEAQWKSDGSPVTIADIRSNDILVSYLESTNIPIISEESEKETFSVRKHYETVWCVDPLDGTKEFLKKNGEFAICVALIHQGKSILGIIASPVQRKIVIGGTEIPPATFRFEEIDFPQKWHYLMPKERVNSPLIIATSRSHPGGSEQSFTNTLKHKFGEIAYLRKGSALKFMDLAMGEADVYPRFAPTMEWDIAAGQAIIEALGGTVCEVESEEVLRYNKEDLYNPYFIVKTAAMLS